LCANCRRVFHAFLDDTPAGPDHPALVEETTSEPVAESLFAPALAFADVPMELPRDGEAPPATVLKELLDVETGPAAVPAHGAPMKAETIEGPTDEPAARPEPVKPEAASALSAGSRIAPSETKPPAPRPVPPVGASTRAGSPAQSRRGTASLVGVVAAVALGVAIGMGVGAYWLRMRTERDAQRAETTAPASTVAERVTDRVEARRAATKARAEIRAPAATEPNAADGTARLASNVAPPRPQPKLTRQVPALAPAPPVVFAPAPRVELAVREAEPPAPPEAVATAPAVAPVASAAPLRPFFETKDVNESPQVASRVEPQLPGELRARAPSDVVVVRLLVSQTGHPYSVSLLRRSKAGQSLDDAVVTAVKQWTFSPARKKGEAVSCWLNVGVPIGGVN
jgi:protein TonB